MNPIDILVVDDDIANRTVLGDILRDNGHEVTVCSNGTDALLRLEENSFDLLITDLKMPGMDGVTLLEKALAIRPELDVILMTAYGTVSSAVEAMQKGATDYLQKPFDKNELLVRVRNVARRVALKKENRHLRKSLGERSHPRIEGESSAVKNLLKHIERIAPSPGDVLITGESGTGKELVARALHHGSTRAVKPFVAVNCAAISEGLAESEIFGHQRGAFTNATQDRIGRFEQAAGGTLFLDEISAMPLGLQPKLLRVLQDRRIEPLGSDRSRQIDLRVISASNRDLRTMVDKGLFREDLYHRLNVLEINIPPLRQRAGDIPLLARRFCEHAAERCGLPVPEILPELMDALTRYAYPGNVRELEHLMEKMVVLSEDEPLGLADLPGDVVRAIGMGANPALQEDDSRDASTSSGRPEMLLSNGPISLMDVEKTLLKEAVRLSDGNLSEAARRLGLSYKTLRYRIHKFGLDGEDSPD